jgi:DNA-binding response OmpR family regulator
MARLLLIDDDPSLLEALTLAFEDAGHVVVTASDGAAGERLLRAETPRDAATREAEAPVKVGT